MKIELIKLEFKEKVLFLVLLFSLLSIYSPVFDYGFTGWDDTGIILENPALLKGGLQGFGMILKPGSIPHEQLYMPITYLSFLAEKTFFNLAPSVMHFDNFLLHLLNALLVYCLIRSLGGTFHLSFLCSVIFAVHPLQVESVAWLAGRKELLCVFFSIPSLICWNRYILSSPNICGELFPSELKFGEKPMPSTRVIIRKNHGFLLLSIVFFCLAVLSKPSAAILPIIMLLLLLFKNRNKAPVGGFGADHSNSDIIITEKSASGVYCPVPEEKRENLMDSIFLAPFFLISILTYMINDMTSFAGPGGQLKYVIYRGSFIPLIFTESVERYLLLKENCAFYSWFPIINGNLSFIPYILTGTFIMCTFYFWRRKFSAAVLYALCFLTSLLPSLALVVSSYRDFCTADRYAYFPIVWFFAFMLVNIQKAKSCLPKIAMNLFVIFFIAVSAVHSSEAVKRWKNAETLWKSVIKADPSCPLAYYNLGNHYFRLSKYKEAMDSYEKCLKNFPDYEAAYNLAICHETSGDLVNAEKYYRISIGINPRYINAEMKLGKLLLKEMRYQEASSVFRKILEMSPDCAEASFHIAEIEKIQSGK